MHLITNDDMHLITIILQMMICQFAERLTNDQMENSFQFPWWKLTGSTAATTWVVGSQIPGGGQR